MNFKKKLLFISLFSVTILLIGYLREFIFSNINNQIYIATHPFSNNQEKFVHPSLSFLHAYSAQTLSAYKWVLTVLFTLIYFLIGDYVIKNYLTNHSVRKLHFVTYLIMFGSSFIVSTVGFFTPQQWTYTTARHIMGVAQSPIVLMILIATFRLTNKQNTL